MYLVAPQKHTSWCINSPLDPRDYVLAENGDHRHLTSSQKAAIAAPPQASLGGTPFPDSALTAATRSIRREDEGDAEVRRLDDTREPGVEQYVGGQGLPRGSRSAS